MCRRRLIRVGLLGLEGLPGRSRHLRPQGQLGRLHRPGLEYLADQRDLRVQVGHRDHHLRPLDLPAPLDLPGQPGLQGLEHHRHHRRPQGQPRQWHRPHPEALLGRAGLACRPYPVGLACLLRPLDL
jgi:hypothetical protein